MRLTEQLQQFLNRYEEQIRAEAESLAQAAIPELTEAGFDEFDRGGSRKVYEASYFQRRKMLFMFGMKAVIDGEAPDFANLERIIRSVCDEFTWAVPAHVERRSDPGWRETVDLFAAETGQALSELITVLGDRLPAALRSLVRDNVIRRVIDSYLNTPAPYRVFEAAENNWNAVCNGSIGMAALYLLKEEPEKLELVLSRIHRSLPLFLAGYRADGACEEGLGYWTYGMSYYAAYAELLGEFTGGKTDLLAGDKCGEMMKFQQKCYFESGQSICFSDGRSDSRFRVGLTSYLRMCNSGVRFPDVKLAADVNADHCYRWASGYRDWLWTRAYLRVLVSGPVPAAWSAGRPAAGAVAGAVKSTEDETGGLSGCDVLPDVQWAICRGAHQTGMACKGGHNGESHNHNDVGSFYVIKGDTMLLADLGAGEYTKDYFREGRYEYLGNSSRGHNVPLINGLCQQAGREFRADAFVRLRAGELQTDASAGNGAEGFRISFASAYPAGLIAKLERHLTFDAAAGWLKVEDVFVPSENTRRITENFVTRQRVRVEGTKIYLGADGVLAIQTGAGPVTVHKEIFINHDGGPEEVYLIQWEVPVTEQTGRGEIVCRYFID